MNFTACHNIKQRSKNSKLNLFFNCLSALCPEPSGVYPAPLVGLKGPSVLVP